MTNRLTWLDSVRGLAALAVLIEHYIMLRFDAYNAHWRGIFHFGYGAVVAFLLVSGYVIPLTLEKSNNLGRFWRSRIFRLYPMYLVATALAIAMHVTGHPNVGDLNYRDHLASNAAVSMTMLQGVFHIPNALGVTWSLTVEMAFYLIVTALFALGWHKKSVALASVAAILAVALPLLGVPIDPGLVVCWAAPYIGVLFYRAHQSEIPVRSTWSIYGAMLAVLAILWWLLPANKGEMAGAIGGFVFFGTFFALPSLGNRVFAWLGQISYSVYLLHPFTVFALPRLWAKFPVLYNPLVSLPLAILATVAIAALTYKLIENPMNQIGRRTPRSQTVLASSQQ